MKKYSRVSYEERCQIFALLQAKTSKPEIARILGRNKSTIYRELKRITAMEPEYKPSFAQELRIRVQRKQRRKKLIVDDIKEIILSKLYDRWSPELISGRLRKEKVAQVSHQTIYNYIDKNRPLKPLLKFGTKYGLGRKAQRNLSKTKYKSIHERPKSVLNRNRFGHW